MNESQKACQRRACQTKPQSTASHSSAVWRQPLVVPREVYLRGSLFMQRPGPKAHQGKFLLVTRSQWTSLLPSFCAKLLDLSQRNGQPSYKFSCCLSDTGQQFTGSGWPYDQGQPYLGGQTLWGAAACGPHLRTVPMH